MPFAIDEERFTKDTPRGQKLVTLDISKGNLPGGLPLKEIPHMEFPRLVYKHPKEPFKKVIHRNANHEVVEVEMVSAEHLTLAVNDKAELKKALDEGWVKEPYIQQAPPDPNAELYETK